jgi:MFS family permease
MIIAFLIALFAKSALFYGLFFLFFGIALDGFSISGMNLVIEIAPEDKRPAYAAIQTNLTSFGLFFPILGGFLLKSIQSFEAIYVITIILLFFGFLISKKLNAGKGAKPAF